MLIRTADAFAVLLRRLRAAKVVVVDAETSGLDHWTNHTIGLVLTLSGDPKDSFYVPVRHGGGGNLPSKGYCQQPADKDSWDGSVHSAETAIIAALANKLLVFHNAPFDMRFMHRLGWRPTGPINDTMVMAFLTNEVRPNLSLDGCCRDERVQAKKGQELYSHIAKIVGCEPTKDSMAHLWRLPGDDPVVVDYACGDGTSTWQLWESLTQSIAKPYYSVATREFTLSKVAEVEMALIPVLHNMSMRGTRIDEEQLDKVIKHFQGEYDSALMKVGGINVKAPSQVKAYLEKEGETSWPLTPLKKPSFPEEWLNTTEAGRAIVLVRKNRTLLDNFLRPMKTKFMHNGRIHPQFHQTRDEEYGTKTGRLSVTEPNVGAMPGKRQGERGKVFRTIFVPDDGMEFCEADFANMEIRIAAHYCKARLWVDGFFSGLGDPHTAVAQELGIERKHAKTINLALMTGTGKKAIAAKLGVPFAEGSAIVDRYFEGLDELKRFQDWSSGLFFERKFIATLLGRRLQLVDDRAYTSVNRLTQGGNADVIKSCMVRASKVDNCQMALTVYDSMLFQNEKGDVASRDKMLSTMADMQGMGVDLSVPMAIEYCSGASWSEATFGAQTKLTWFKGQPYIP